MCVGFLIGSITCGSRCIRNVKSGGYIVIFVRMCVISCCCMNRVGVNNCCMLLFF